MDYSKLRATALTAGEAEEAVTVDTRALIDKVLARYSGEWTTLRELIQNAADAQATTVKIKWETLPSTSVALPSTTSSSELLKHTLTQHTLRRLLVENDGQPFTKTDWGRLKRIAEGNPDETKIGAFGVGFYSVFADCEEPFVSSGSEAMAFYWKGNALFTKKLQLPAEQASNKTIFVLDYRNTTTPMPNLLSVAQFLATSLTFVALQKIEFWIDDWKVLELQKKSSPSQIVQIPRDIETKTREGLMKLASVERTRTQIDAIVMNAVGWKPQAAASSTRSNDPFYFGSGQPEIHSLRNFFSRLTAGPSNPNMRGRAAKDEKEAMALPVEDLTETSRTTVFLGATTGSITTSISASFSAELERATKKPPPKTTKIALLTSSYDETLASGDVTSNADGRGAADVFSTVLPSKKPGGRIFIGFPTTQTTGAGMHISAPSVIPTVEREAIDLNARWVRNWNIEMLRVAGIMSRLTFAIEMQELQTKLMRTAETGSKKAPTADNVNKLVPEALHILKTFSFSDSTPSSNVAQIIEEAFWTAYKRPSVEVYSSRGVLMTTKVRKTSEDLSRFVDGIPVVLDSMKDAPFIKKLTDFQLIQDISVDDVYSELSAKALNRDQLRHFISWAAKSALAGELDPSSKRKLFDVAVATISEDGSDQGEIIALGTITNYLTENKIPAELPVPPTTMPHIFTSHVPVNQLQALGWEPLEIVPWLRFLLDTASRKSDEQNLTKTPKFAAQVLAVLSKNWDRLSASSQNSVVEALRNVTVVPTRAGMKKPGDAFFASVKLFDDLPTVFGLQSVKDKFLAALGVRKTVDLDTIFTRLLNPSAEAAEQGRKKWSHMELVKYLTSVADDIPKDDMKKLMELKWCPAEAGPPGLESTQATTELYRVSELFEPKDTLRALDLRILQWPGPPGSYRTSAKEARFLQRLGLRHFPSVPELIKMMSSEDPGLRTKSMSYFIANHHINGYASFDVGSTAEKIMPVTGNEKLLVRPSECYTNAGAAVLGFNILRGDLHKDALKFGVAPHPPMTECVNRLLQKPPQSRMAAIPLFEYFATRVGDLGSNDLAKLKNAAFVPVMRKKRLPQSSEKPDSGSVLEFVKPGQCYLGHSATYEEIFDFVDFGGNANIFLFKCGAKSEPSRIEIARLASSEPARLLSVLQSPEKYLNLLRTLAEDWNTLKKDRDLVKQMRTSPFLLASKEIPSVKARDADNPDEEEAAIRQYQLASASQIVLLDDYIAYRLFKDDLICAPEEDVLETFYKNLGSQELSSLIKEDLRVGPRVEDQAAAMRLRKHVVERTKLFVLEYAKMARDAIRRDARWLDANLTVAMVRSVSLRRSLRGNSASHTEKRSAASANSGKDGWILYVSAETKIDMYQVGIAVCHLLLNRPNQQAYFFFEPFLKLDLLELKGRGYNVDRILRAKAAEARIAEESRRKALEEEQKRIDEQQREWATQKQAETPVKGAISQMPEREKERAKMPGGFDDSPPQLPAIPAPPVTSQGRRPKGLFSNLTRKLGLDRDEDSDSDDEPARSTTPKPLPAPPTDNGSATGNGTAAGPRPQTTHNNSHAGDNGRVTSPSIVQQNLLQAIRSTRAHDSANLFTPPKAEEVKEQSTYCDSMEAKNIVFAAEAPRGTRLFVSRDLKADPSELLRKNQGAIADFEKVLLDVGSIYGVAARSLNLFYDEVGGTIAFNSNGSVFCNLRYYLQLHAAKASSTANGGQGMAEAVSWWWVVIAHELAHNLVSQHNADHSYYTESFVQLYFGKMMEKAQALKGGDVAGSASSRSAGNEVPVSVTGSNRRAETGFSQVQGGRAPPPPYQSLLD
jgi:hypothetical protein